MAIRRPVWLVILAALAASPAHAQQLLLDEEFNHAATVLTAPLRSSLAPQIPVQFVLVSDPSINAFVTQENIVYVNSGLIYKATSAAALQGVLAHELGHIAANHLFQQDIIAKQSTVSAIAGMALGVGAAMAGSGQAATALMMGGQAGAMQNFMAHTRTQEAEADRRAINALHEAKLSAQGMVDMFTTLRTESQLSYDAPPPWLVTHPLPPERLANLNQELAAESPKLKADLEQVNTSINYPRLQAKVAALTMSAPSVLRRYNGQDEVSRYARALAYFNQGRLDFASTNLMALTKLHPDDPFYNELAAKLALQKGDLGTARDLFLKITDKNPGFTLIQYQLAEVMRNQEDWSGARTRYELVTRQWPQWADPWLGLGLVYGNQGKLAESHLARAQGYLVAPDLEAARQSLALAKEYLKKTPDPKAQEWANTLQTRLDAAK